MNMYPMGISCSNGHLLNQRLNVSQLQVILKIMSILSLPNSQTSDSNGVTNAHRSFPRQDEVSIISSFFKKWANPGLFFIYFWYFQTNNKNFTPNQFEKMSCPSSIRRWDSNPRPLKRESPPITTSPGLPPFR